MLYPERKQIWRARATNDAGEIWIGIRLDYFDFMTGAADGHSRGFQLAVRFVKTAAQ
jgi:hypothetical protein